jgi:uncharacterized protein with GYD domain
MAKRSVKESSANAPDEKEVIYFLLISVTAKGRMQKMSVVLDEQRSITKLVKRLGGSCELFSIRGPYDVISIIQGVSVSAAMRVVQLVEAGGNVNALLAPAFRIFK